MSTADWAVGPAIVGSRTWTRQRGNRWGTRKVRPDGTVRWMGRTWRPAGDVQTLPEPGEWLLFCDYGPDYKPTAYEWTAPPDPDNYIRRMYWELTA